MNFDLSLIDTPIRRDAAGRYCLNDLHKAAGGLGHHRPSKWLANKQTQAQIEALNLEARNRASKLDQFEQGEAGIPALVKPEFGPDPKARIRALGNDTIEPVVSIQGGEWSGVYVVKELVYSYAMWISAAFYIKVVRAYDAMVTGQLNAMVKPLTQAEKFWFSKRPHWQLIRALVFDGFSYAQVGQRLGRSAGSVGRCIRRMTEAGLIDPVAFIRLRYFPRTAERLVAANKQGCLDWGVAA